MSYLEELKAHYKAVKKRIAANAISPPKALAAPVRVKPPEPEPVFFDEPEPKPEPSGVLPAGTETVIVNEALIKTNPALLSSTPYNVQKLADEIVNSPRLPPIPGLVLHETGAVRWMRILHAVAKEHKVEASEILGRSRRMHIINARFEVFYRLRIDLAFTYPQIARLMRKDHSTIMHGVHKVRQQLLDGRLRKGDYVRAGSETPTGSATHTPAPGVLAV